MTDLALRSVTDADRDFLWTMLYEAAFWRAPSDQQPLDEAMQSAELRRYLKDWGREGDRGLIATAGGDRLGAAWYRLFAEDERGYGFVEATIPELSMAVGSSHRRQGVGRLLLAGLLVQAHFDGFLALSLSVEEDNPARSTYEQFGFEFVEERGNAWTMINRFSLR